MQEHATLPHQEVLSEGIKSYSAWLEVEIGLDQHSIPLPHAERVELFTKRIATGLIALENAAPGIRAKLEVHDGRPFAFTARLSEKEIRAIWHLPELRLLSDRGAHHFPDPEPDELGRRPFIVHVSQHIQAEGSNNVAIQHYTLLLHACDETHAMADVVEQCSTTMPPYFMDNDYVIHRRWWTAERASLNTMREEERGTLGTTTILHSMKCPKEKREAWHPDHAVERATYGSPKQRPETWEWMIS